MTAPAFESVSAAVSGTASTATFGLSGSPSRQLLIATFAFEDVLASGGPWVVDSDGTGIPPKEGAATGWQRVLYEPPSADGGNGLEVWSAYWISGSGSSIGQFIFTASLSFVMRVLVYNGEYDPGGLSPFPVTSGAIRASTKAQATGDDPAATSIYTYVDERVVALAADQLQSPGATPPAGWTSRFDSARGGTFGNVELTAADKPTTVEGNTGSIPFTATASTGTTKGATATLAIRPEVGPSTPPATTSPLIAIDYPIALT